MLSYYGGVNNFEIFEAKAIESIAGARSELANGRYNNVANRAYFAAYQAAIVALIRAGFSRTIWGHDEVQALFSGQLINRRKTMPAELRAVLNGLSSLRVLADYEARPVSRSAATRALRDAGRFLELVIVR